jgi:hypothetical protein
VRDGLRIGKVDRLSSLQTATEFPLHLHGANLYTGFTKGATLRIDESRLPNDGYVEISTFPFNLYHF